jgi:hypothetical protein
MVRATQTSRLPCHCFSSVYCMPYRAEVQMIDRTRGPLPLPTLRPSCSPPSIQPGSFDYAMSQVLSTATSGSSKSFETIFTAALDAYKKQTKKDIASHPLATQLQSCDSSSAILAVLRTQVQTFDQSQDADENWTKWLDPTVNVLYAFSTTLGNGVGVVSCGTLSRARPTL